MEKLLDDRFISNFCYEFVFNLIYLFHSTYPFYIKYVKTIYVNLKSKAHY